MYKYILFFLLICGAANAQNIQVKSKADHPYRHIPVDLNSTNSPSDGDAPTYNSTTKTFKWGASGGGTSNGACWEIDTLGALQPVSGNCTDTLWDLDSLGALEPT